MIELLLDVVPFIGGALMGYYMRPLPKKTPPPTDTELTCPHVWEPWSEPLIEDLLHPTKENTIIGIVVTQQRRCTICGITQYDQKTHEH